MWSSSPAIELGRPPRRQRLTVADDQIDERLARQLELLRHHPGGGVALADAPDERLGAELAG